MNNKYKILEAVSTSCEVPVKIISGSRRTRKASYARDICSFLMHQCGYSHENISRILNRERTSVTHGIKRVNKRLQEDTNQGRFMRVHIRDILDNQLGMNYISIDE